MSKNCYNERKNCNDEKQCFFDKKDLHDEKKKKEIDFSDYEYIPNPYFHKHCKEDHRSCCCNYDFYKLLKEFVNNPHLQAGINGARFAFLSKTFLYGTNLELYSTWSALGNDNINTPTAFFNGFDNCSCEYINVSNGTLTYPTAVDIAAGPATQQLPLPIDKVSLCSLDAIVFDYNVTATDFIDDLLRILYYDVEECEISNCKDCCCNKAITNRISNYPSLVNVAAGWLALYQVDYLGRFGDIAVFLNSSTASPTRVYLVCSNAISYFGTGLIPS